MRSFHQHHPAQAGAAPDRCSPGSRGALAAALAAMLVAFLPTPVCSSEPYSYDREHEVLGTIGTYTVRNSESLYEIARTCRTGYNEITAANPGIDPYVPGQGTTLVLPTAWILPDAARTPGIIINLSEMRLYYFFTKDGRSLVRTYPIGIGDLRADTPLGTFTVVEKIAHPAWHVPASIRKEKPELPAVVPPGPDNPMGSHALRLSRRTILIHGTDMPWGIGRRVSHGCIRLYPEDIVELYRLVPLATRVTIVEQPVRIGVSGGRVYAGVTDSAALKGDGAAAATRALLKKKGLLASVDPDKLAAAVREKRGLPVDITRER